MEEEPVPTTSGDERALQEIERRLVRDYPTVPSVRVVEILRACYERTNGAKVPNYRLVLAERDARVRLRREPARSPGVAAPGEQPLVHE